VRKDTLGRQVPLGTPEDFEESEPKEQRPMEEGYNSLDELRRSLRRSKKDKMDKKKRGTNTIDVAGWGSVFA